MVARGGGLYLCIHTHVRRTLGVVSCLVDNTDQTRATGGGNGFRQYYFRAILL